eukprot:s5483_g1.t1
MQPFRTKWRILRPERSILSAGPLLRCRACRASTSSPTMAKKKKPPRIEGPPQASLEEINEVLLAKSAKVKPPAGAGITNVNKKTKKSASKSAPTASAKKSVDGAKLALELLEASTTQLLRRKGWFRDVRLRRSADALP